MCIPCHIALTDIAGKIKHERWIKDTLHIPGLTESEYALCEMLHVDPATIEHQMASR